jgi:FAD/FMN-containing dehydrogenase
MPQEWSDWSGGMRFVPGSLESPATEEGLSDLVRRAAARGGTVRVVGAGHSMPPLLTPADSTEPDCG